MDIEDRHLKIIQNILNKYPYSFYVFGSRAHSGQAKRFSDLDLCTKDAIPHTILSKIEGDFEESDLPYTVDIVRYGDCDAFFAGVLDRTMIPFYVKKEK